MGLVFGQEQVLGCITHDKDTPQASSEQVLQNDEKNVVDAQFDIESQL